MRHPRHFTANEHFFREIAVLLVGWTKPGLEIIFDMAYHIDVQLPLLCVKEVKDGKPDPKRIAVRYA